MKENPSSIFDNAINLAIEAKNTLKQIPGIAVLDHPYMDPLRVTVGVHDLGVSGYEADDFIYMDQRVVSELSGSRFITLPFSPGTCREHVNRLILAFKNLSSSSSSSSFIKFNSMNGRVGVDLEPWSDIKMKLTPREAFFAKKKKVDIKDATGKICGELICPYPPGFPIITLGEVISQRVVDILQQSIVDGAKIIGSCDPLLSSMLIYDV
ncbi:uncharacterized protein LOC110683891 [Chenopodium quinoa]|uniref:uncharacterized protein LOC110683891 n=1 Tax=Chenopodium quinoa TaxID=63459 RepID=UPI000B77F9D4|nr:uncharacterized protein LOC110683891 [Chenopodium quinoa]